MTAEELAWQFACNATHFYINPFVTDAPLAGKLRLHDGTSEGQWIKAAGTTTNGVLHSLKAMLLEIPHP